MKPGHWLLRLLRLAMLLSVCVLGWLIADPDTVLADAPGTRGDESAPHGSIGSTVTWADVTPLAPLGAAPSSALPRTVGQPGSTVMPEPVWYQADQPLQASAVPWLSRVLNPGNWILDAGLGIIAAVFNMGNEWLLAWLHLFLGQLSTPEAAPALTCEESAAMAYIICTNPALIFGSTTDQALNPLGSAIAARLDTIWTALRPAATGLITMLFVVRLGRMLIGGQRDLTAEGRSLLLAFCTALIGIQATAVPLRWLFEFFYALNNTVLAGMDAAINRRIWIPILSGPVVGGASVQLAQILGVFIVLIPLTFLVTIAVIRLVKMVLLVALAPLAAATLIDPSTAGFFRRWLERLVDLLLQQTMWALAFALGLAIIDMLPHLDLTTPTSEPALGMVVQSLYACIVLLLVLLSRQLFDNLIAAGVTGAAVSMLSRRWVLPAGGVPFAVARRAAGSAPGGSSAGRARPPAPSTVASPSPANNRNPRATSAAGRATGSAPSAGAPAAAATLPGARAAAAVRQPLPTAIGPTQAVGRVAATGPTQPLGRAPTGVTVPGARAPASTGGASRTTGPTPQRPTSIRTTLRLRKGGQGSSGGTSQP